MTLNPSIILAGQQPNFMNVLQSANTVAGQTNAIQQQNALSQLYRDQGAGILSGDQGAMNALAALDPAAAMSARAGHQEFSAGQQRMQILGAQERRAAEEYARGLSAAEAAAEAEQAERAATIMLSATSPEQWDALAAQYGQGDLVGQYANRQTLAAQYMELSEVMRMQAEATDPMDAINLRQEEVALALAEADLAAGPQPADEYERYVAEETAAGRVPLSRIEYAQAKRADAGMSVRLPDGTVISQGGAAIPDLTQGEANASMFLNRAQSSNQILNEMESQGTRVGQRIASGLGLAGNFLLDPEYQQFDQAQRDFVNAILRQESGAVIAESEFDNAARQYFPQPGDSDEVIAQKRRNRETAIEGLGVAAGEGARVVDELRSQDGIPEGHENTAFPTSEDEYNALPSGSVYLFRREDGTVVPMIKQ